jgi:hypothetical protein
MRLLNVISPLALLAVLPLACGPTATTKPNQAGPANSVELVTVTLAGLNAAVAEQKGKVVLIDVWFRG